MAKKIIIEKRKDQPDKVKVEQTEQVQPVQPVKPRRPIRIVAPFKMKSFRVK